MKRLELHLSKAKRVGIVGHRKPDGDCIGACLALQHYLEQRYPRLTVMAFLEEIPTAFTCVEGIEKLQTKLPKDPSFDLMISVDCSDQTRHGRFYELFASAGLRVNIDHHISNLQFGDINEVQPQVSATCELLYELMDPQAVDSQTAMALYLGIAHDTGVFRYSNTSRRTLQIAGELIAYGFPFYDLIDRTFYQRTWTQNRLMGAVLSNSQCYFGGQLMISYADAGVFTQLGAALTDTDGIVEQLRITEGVRVAVAFFETQDGSYKVSLRATDDTDVAAVAVKYGGGGHRKAAGFTSRLAAQELIRVLTEEFSVLWRLQTEKTAAAK